jgi:CRISPR-associated protein Cas2
MNDERVVIVTYDISDQRRWRQVFKTMHGYGDWLQLSVFQCRLSRRRRSELETRLRELVKNGEDHVLLIDVGPAEKIELVMESIGKNFSRIERQATVIWYDWGRTAEESSRFGAFRPRRSFSSGGMARRVPHTLESAQFVDFVRLFDIVNINAGKVREILPVAAHISRKWAKIALTTNGL